MVIINRQTIGWEEAFKDDLKEAFLCSLIHQDPLRRQILGDDQAKTALWQQKVWTEKITTDLPVNEQNLVTFKKNVYTVNLYIFRQAMLTYFLFRNLIIFSFLMCCYMVKWKPIDILIIFPVVSTVIYFI